jgi:hypothetical protein
MNRCCALALVALVACAPRAPRRPVGVPAEAVWAGDRSGGHFVLIGSQTARGWNLGIYDDHTGVRVAQGEFWLRGTARAELHPAELGRFDGKVLHLTDGSTLVPR